MPRKYGIGLLLFLFASLGPSGTAEAVNFKLRAHKITTTIGEDGSGNTVVAVTPVAFDVIAPSWGARALDPVLHVGDQHFHQYTFPDPGVMRYVASDANQLPEGVVVWIRWGEDENTRVTLDRSFEVPR